MTLPRKRRLPRRSSVLLAITLAAVTLMIWALAYRAIEDVWCSLMLCLVVMVTVVSITAPRGSDHLHGVHRG
jgi:hypothetical protein